MENLSVKTPSKKNSYPLHPETINCQSFLHKSWSPHLARLCLLGLEQVANYRSCEVTRARAMSFPKKTSISQDSFPLFSSSILSSNSSEMFSETWGGEMLKKIYYLVLGIWSLIVAGKAYWFVLAAWLV